MFLCRRNLKKITNRLKKEWAEGIRSGHSDKLKEYWKNCGEERKKQQSEVMSKAKTKYYYTIYDPDGNLITETGTYTTLKELNLKSAMCSFKIHNSDDVFCKKFRIIRRKINEEIVQPDLKESDELK